MSQRQHEASHPKLDSLSFPLTLFFCVYIWMINKELSLVQDAASVAILLEAFLSFLRVFTPQFYHFGGPCNLHYGTYHLCHDMCLHSEITSETVSFIRAGTALDLTYNRCSIIAE